MRVVAGLAGWIFLWSSPAVSQPASVRPVLESTYQTGINDYLAFFGYLNENATVVHIPVGGDNKFTPNPQDRGQTTSFDPGRNRNVFSVAFDGQPLVWTLEGPDGRRRTSTASSNNAIPLGSVDLNLSASQEASGEAGEVWVVFTLLNQNLANSSQSTRVDIEVPDGLVIVDVNAEVGTVNSVSGGLRWDVGVLDPQQSRWVRILFQVPSETSEVEGGASHSGPDHDPSDNEAEVTLNGEGSSGNDGGLESNGRLAVLVARRNLLRGLPSVLKSSALRSAPASELPAFIPLVGPKQTSAVETTPTDLVGVTNAGSVYAVDYFTASQRRLGAVLGVVTEDGPYDHTKAVCDRFSGSELESLREVEIHDIPFALAKIRHPGGNTDYSISFAVSPDTWPLVVDSRWNLFGDETLKDRRLYNFQVWGANADFTVALVGDILSLLPRTTPKDFSAQLPRAFVKSGSYRNGVLRLTLGKLDPSIEELSIRGTLTRVESGSREEFTQNLPYSDTLELSVGNVFDLAFSVDSDFNYHADGTWSHWSQPGEGEITDFQVLRDSRSTSQGEFLLERGVRVRGAVRDAVHIFRHLLPGVRPLDLSAFDSLEFTASGNVPLRVVAQKEGDTSLAGPFQTTVNLSREPQRFTLSFADFGAGFTAENLTTLVFQPLGDGARKQSFEVSIEDVAFPSVSSPTSRPQPRAPHRARSTGRR